MTRKIQLIQPNSYDLDCVTSTPFKLNLVQINENIIG